MRKGALCGIAGAIALLVAAAVGLGVSARRPALSRTGQSRQGFS